MEFLLMWLIWSVAVWLTATLLPGVHVKNFGSAILIAAAFGVLNFLLGWLLFTIFTIATLGLAWLLSFITHWIINAIILKLIDAFTDRLDIDGIAWTLGAAAVMALLGGIGEALLIS
ncbi:MAG: phage holin family protein [Persicimonas sp.]